MLICNKLRKVKKVHQEKLETKNVATIIKDENSNLFSQELFCHFWGHTRLRMGGWRSPNSEDWRKRLAICLLYVVHCTLHTPQSNSVSL